MQQLGLQEMDGMNAEMHAEDVAGGNPLQSLANKVSPIKSQRGRSKNKAGQRSASGSKSKSPSKSNKSSPNQKKQEMQSRRAAAKKFAEELKTGMHR